MAGQLEVAVLVGLRRGWNRRRDCKQGAAQRELGGAMTVGQEPNVADAMKAVGHGMQQKPPHKLVGWQRHHLGLAVMAVVLIHARHHQPPPATASYSARGRSNAGAGTSAEG